MLITALAPWQKGGGELIQGKPGATYSKHQAALRRQPPAVAGRQPPQQSLNPRSTPPPKSSPAIACSRNSSRKLRTQIGLLHEAVLAPYDRKEIALRLYLQIFTLDIAEAHHAPV
jgi:hypothetical protein